MREVLGGVPMPIVIIGKDERVLFVNDMAGKEFKVDTDRLYGFFFRHPDLVAAIDAALRGELSVPATVLLRRGHLDTLYEVSVLSVSKGALCSFLDVTALQTADQMRRDFVANVSHELRTPLTSLLGFIETLRGAAKDDAKARERFLAIMANEAERMNRLVGDLLQLSRVEAEERNRPTEEVDLAGAIRSVCHTLRPIADGSSVTLRPMIEQSPAIMLAHADQITQVLSNLIENALKYGSVPGGEVIIALKREIGPRGPQLMLYVQDFGEGIEEQHIARLTERFYRVDDHRSRQMGGTGLGLAIVKHIVNRHRGRLVIESERGKGSKFSVIFPVF
jgi:two-component system phosphate regulon sensor histidine kinase PhoR